MPPWGFASVAQARVLHFIHSIDLYLMRRGGLMIVSVAIRGQFCTVSRLLQFAVAKFGFSGE